MFRKKKKHASPKFKIFFFISLVIAVVGLNIWQFRWTNAILGLNGETMHVQVAKNRYQLKKGIKEKTSFGEYDGMLFLYPGYERHGVSTFDLPFPVDIIWFYRGIVVDVAKNVSPYTEENKNAPYVYYPRGEGNLVLLLPSGWANEHNVVLGNELEVIEE